MSDTAKHFGHHSIFSAANQTGNSNATPYILGTTTGTIANNTLTLSATLKGAGNNVPANQNLVIFVPPASENVIGVTQGQASQKTGSTDEVEIGFTVTSKGVSGPGIIHIYPEGRLDLMEEIHFRVLSPLPASPPVIIAPSGATALSPAITSQVFTVSYGAFPDADVAKIEWHVSPSDRAG